MNRGKHGVALRRQPKPATATWPAQRDRHAALEADAGGDFEVPVQALRAITATYLAGRRRRMLNAVGRYRGFVPVHARGTQPHHFHASMAGRQEYDVKSALRRMGPYVSSGPPAISDTRPPLTKGALHHSPLSPFAE